MIVWPGFCSSEFAICSANAINMFLHLRRNNRRKGVLRRLTAAWSHQVETNPSQNEVLKDTWLQAGYDLFHTKSPVMPAEIQTIGGGEDSQDEANGWRPGSKKRTVFVLPRWISDTAMSILDVSYKTRKGQDKEHHMRFEYIHDDEDDAAVPVHQKHQWMVRKGDGDNAKPFDMLPGLFEIDDPNGPIGLIASGQQLEIE